MVMVLNLGVCSRFLTKDVVDIDVLICGSNFPGSVVFSKDFVYSGTLWVLGLLGKQICGGWLGDAW
jgi:hypothetical protein